MAFEFVIIGSLLLVLALYAFYLACLAVVVLARDEALSPAQRVLQVLASLLIPILGPLLVLHAASHYTNSNVRQLPLVWPL